MTQEKLHINGKDFIWGMTFEQILKEFSSENLFSGWSAWENFELQCSEIANLKTLTCSFRGPSLNRPVMQVSFDLATIKPKLFEKPHTPYVKHLTAILGKPHGISKNRLENGQKYNQGYANSTVIYNCKWWLGDVLISLSVFGGIRTKDEGEYAAGLYFDLLNEERTAKPYYKEFIDRESELTKGISNVKKITIKYDSRPYHRNHYELKEPHLALKNRDVRTSQLILYTDKLYRTPIELSEDLSDNQIVLFKSQKTDKWCVGNKWDFTPITIDSKLSFVDIKPARGSGGTRIDINSLTINGERDSKPLVGLSNKIEELTGQKFEHTMGYDD
jgi:hypothetical protein